MKHSPLLSSLMLAGALSLTACSDDADTPTPLPDVADTDTNTNTDTDTQTDTDSDTDGEGPTSTNIEGNWAMLEVQTAVVNVLGTTMEQFSQNYFLVSIKNGSTAAQLCNWVTADSTNIYETVMPQSLLEMADSLIRTYEVSEDFTFTTSEAARTFGVNLEDPFEDAMPTAKDDPRLYDQDEDGNPGITLLIQGNIQGRLFSAIRHKASLSGKLLSDTHIKGLTSWSSDQLSLGGEPEFIASQDIQQTASPEPEKSHFEMIKVELSDTCETINAKRQELFGR